MYNHQLDAFVRAAELGSFAKAAQSMFISPPALLQQINLLEQRCGVSLFHRSNQGVTLTPAGQSLYRDAKAMIQLSQDALERARQIAARTCSTVRVGTALLFKCRLLPRIWEKVRAQCPDLKLEILPLGAGREGPLGGLGEEYDLVEGIYGSTAYRGLCGFLELMPTPFCCAVAPGHPLAGREKLSMADLEGETLVLPVPGVSGELDAFRREVVDRFPGVKLVDSPCYGVDTFALCEVKPYVLITQQVYADIHPNLVTIPLDSPYAMPYGLMYARTPSEPARRFLRAVTRAGLGAVGGEDLPEEQRGRRP